MEFQEPLHESLFKDPNFIIVDVPTPVRDDLSRAPMSTRTVRFFQEAQDRLDKNVLNQDCKVPLKSLQFGGSEKRTKISPSHTIRANVSTAPLFSYVTPPAHKINMQIQKELSAIFEEPAPPASMDRPNRKQQELLMVNRPKTKYSFGFGLNKGKVFQEEPSQEEIEKAEIKAREALQTDRDVVNFSDLPTEWDWRIQVDYAGSPVLLPVRDQGDCGSCYAVAAATMLANRYSIETNGHLKFDMSHQDMLNCGPFFVRGFLEGAAERLKRENLIENGTIVDANWFILDGCNGGLLASAVNYIAVKGLPTEAEIPSLFGPTDFINNRGNSRHPQYCRYREQQVYKFYATHAKSLVIGLEGSLPSETQILDPEVLQFNNENMMMAIFNDGPILAAMSVFSDFYYYPALGEVYSKKNSIIVDGVVQRVTYEGGHAIILVGWGEKTNSDGSVTPYWIAQNSWGKDWGIAAPPLMNNLGGTNPLGGGYFLIERGINMCNIEYDAMAVFPNVEKSPLLIDETDAFPFSTSNSGDNNGGSTSQVSSPANLLWIIVGIIVAVIVVIIIVIVTVVLVRRRRLAAIAKTGNE